jgi:Asp-tRNA(Asn)/Glu-tRNA(Gln) amidotransferase C subunit
MKEFTDEEIVRLITELEDIQYYIRYTKDIDKSDVERRIRNIMGKLWNR